MIVNPQKNLHGKRILLGVSGSIAAYKAVELLRRLQDLGAEVKVAMTSNAERFVSRLTFQTLSGFEVPDPEFEEPKKPAVRHIEITDGLDAVIVAPATANIIGKMASGMADDTLTTALLAADCPIIVAPAMNDRMYRNWIVKKNIAFLKDNGFRFVEPGRGQLACGTVGRGRLAEVDSIVQEVETICIAKTLTGMKFLVTAGPTREAIDAVRFISNPSTGKMGFSLAAAARDRGAEVILVAGPTEIAPPHGVTLIRTLTAADMYAAVMTHVSNVDVVIMAAAVSDFRPVSSVQKKIKKHEAATCIELERTEDILAKVGKVPGKRLLVGFAAETDNLDVNAFNKLRDKNLDLIVANDVSKQGAGFAVETNSVIIMDRFGKRAELPMMTKREVAGHIIDRIISLNSP